MRLREELLSLLKGEELDSASQESAIANLLNFNPIEVESKLNGANPDIYARLEQEALSTPFADYYQILLDLEASKTLVDLGAGYCKATLLSQALGMAKDCISLEISPERVGYAQELLKKLGVSSQSAKVFDLLKEPIPIVDAYFLYLPLGPLVFRPIQEVLEKGHQCAFYVVESHGDLLDFFHALPKWFTFEKTLPGQAKRHKEGIHKFRFHPRPIERFQVNSPEVFYWLVRNQEASVSLLKESGEVRVKASSLIPILYNGRMLLECSEIRRIVDFDQVKIARLY